MLRLDFKTFRINNVGKFFNERSDKPHSSLPRGDSLLRDIYDELCLV